MENKSTYCSPGTLHLTIVHSCLFPTYLFPCPSWSPGELSSPPFMNKEGKGPQTTRPGLPTPPARPTSQTGRPLPPTPSPVPPWFLSAAAQISGGAGTVLTCPHAQRAHHLPTSPQFLPDLQRCQLGSTRQVAACTVTLNNQGRPARALGHGQGLSCGPGAATATQHGGGSQGGSALLWQSRPQETQVCSLHQPPGPVCADSAPESRHFPGARRRRKRRVGKGRGHCAVSQKALGSPSAFAMCWLHRSASVTGRPELQLLYLSSRAMLSPSSVSDKDQRDNDGKSTQHPDRPVSIFVLRIFISSRLPA